MSLARTCTGLQRLQRPGRLWSFPRRDETRSCGAPGQWICPGCRQSSSTTRNNDRRLIQRPGYSARIIDGSVPSRRYASTDSNKTANSAPSSASPSSSSPSSSSSSTSSTSILTSGSESVEGSGSASRHHQPNPLPSSSTEELPSAGEQRRSRASKRFSTLMDDMQANIFFAGQRLNDLTGYSGIETLKREIESEEAAQRASQTALAAAKEAYAAAIQRRSDSQREVNELLQRKSTWSPTDLERFTALYRSDHANEATESEARIALDEAERRADEAGERLSRKILARYHEEQIWSDKIRRMSTWGTWGLMGVNVLLFLLFQVAVEPWRRSRLVKGFEEKVKEALESANQNHIASTSEALNAALQVSRVTDSTLGGMETTEETMAAVEHAEVKDVESATEDVVAEEIAAEADLPVEAVTEPGLRRNLASWLPGLGVYRTKVEEIFSERELTVRQVDLTQKALEGAFVGVMVTSIIATLVRGP